MKRGEVKLGDRVLVPGWIFRLTASDPVEAEVTAFLSRWRGEVNVVEVDWAGERRTANVAHLEPTVRS